MSYSFLHLDGEQFTTVDTESTEDAQRVKHSSLRAISVSSVSAVVN
jgi:hypothetical protein